MAQAKVTVFGSLNFDFVILGPRLPKPGETVKGDRFLMQTGGKGANQALQAARLGAKTWMVGCVGQDFMGDEQLSCMTEAGANTDYIIRHGTQKTGTALIFVEQNGQNEIMIAPNANEACTREQLDRAQPAFDKSDVFVTQLETNLDAVLYAMEKARKAGCYILLDPAPMQPVPQQIWKLADLVKPNETEAAYYTGIPVNEANITGWAAKAAARFKEIGAKAVLITLGAKGCWYSGEDEFFVPPYQIKAVDATAAGDSFAGGLATAIGEGRAMGEAISFASACGALSASRAGAQPSIGTRAEVEAFQRQFEHV